MTRRLARDFFARDTLCVAQELLGMHLHVRDSGAVQVARIVETEAYQGPEDLAAHSAGGRRTARTEIMFGPPGYAYVYLIYGVWRCLNFVTREQQTPHAVLLRAVEPVRNVTGKTNGPGLLCRTLGITLAHNGLDLEGDALWLERPSPAEYRAPLVHASPRIGIGERGAYTQLPWRFTDRASSFVSKR